MSQSDGARVVIWWCHVPQSNGVMCHDNVVSYVTWHHLVVPRVAIWWCRVLASGDAMCLKLVVQRVNIWWCHVTI